MIAPIYKKLAKEMEGQAVFVKVDTNAMHELSSRYSVRSLPTFNFFLGGKKVYGFSGAGEGQLRQYAQQIVQKSEFENVLLSKESLITYYSTQDASKTVEDVTKVYDKCVSQIKDKTNNNPDKACVGGVAANLVRSLKKKYGVVPETQKRFIPEEPKADDSSNAKGGDTTTTQQQQNQQRSTKSPNNNNSNNNGKSDQPNLHLATKEQLQAALDKILDAEREAEVENENDDDDDNAENAHSWTPSQFPERVTIIGGGPAGLSAAIYAARAGLRPVVVAPPMGGQLQGKGVDVENYPGLFNVTGPAVVSLNLVQSLRLRQLLVLM
jgi:hypothetical protein